MFPLELDQGTQVKGLKVDNLLSLCVGCRMIEVVGGVELLSFVVVGMLLSSYLHSKGDDFQHTLYAKESGEGCIHIMQRFLVQYALLVVLHGNSSRRTAEHPGGGGSTRRTRSREKKTNNKSGKRDKTTLLRGAGVMNSDSSFPRDPKACY